MPQTQGFGGGQQWKTRVGPDVIQSTAVATTPINSNTDTMLYDATAGALAPVIPLSASMIGRPITFVNIAGAANNVTLTRTAPDQFFNGAGGVNTLVLVPGDSVTIQALPGNRWQVVGESS